MNNPLLVKMQQTLCDLVDNSARIIIVKASTFTFDVRSEISSCNKVLDYVTKEFYSATGRQLVNYTYMVSSVWKTCSTFMIFGYVYVNSSSSERGSLILAWLVFLKSSTSRHNLTRSGWLLGKSFRLMILQAR